MQKIINEIKLDFDDVLIRPKRSKLTSRSEVDISRTFSFLHSTRTLKCIPIVVANMDTTGTFNMAYSLCSQGSMVALHKHYKPEEYISFYSNPNYNNISHLAFLSIGTSHSDTEKLNYILSNLSNKGISLPNICIDVANGYSEKFVKTTANIRKHYSDIIMMAGNVVTGEMVEELLLHGGVDIIKVGIGPGAVCTTRLKTGVGYGQISACLECADAAHGLGGHICADGGCKHAGDVCKAFGCNSDFVMLGSMFAGTDECEGDWTYDFFESSSESENNTITIKRKSALKFYGMSSKEAMEKHHNGVAHYRTSEGRCVHVPYKGKAIEVFQDVCGGIRSASTYIGASKIKDFGKKTTFIMVNNTHTKTYEK